MEPVGFDDNGDEVHLNLEDGNNGGNQNMEEDNDNGDHNMDRDGKRFRRDQDNDHGGKDAPSGKDGADNNSNEMNSYKPVEQREELE